MKHPETVASIRNRLFLLLLRSFVLVVSSLLVFVLAATAFFAFYPSRFNPLDRVPLVDRLTTYYRITGTLQGAESIMPPISREFGDELWEYAILLDAHNRILVYEGQTDLPFIGQIYIPKDEDTRVPLKIEGIVVGTLIFDKAMRPIESRNSLNFLTPVIFISVFLAILTILIGLLLTRRFVMPLSEVIAAARTLAAGDLTTRVPVSGPDDLRALSDSFNHMAAALERSDSERRNMLADIAHELRTPLTVIRGKLEGIVDGVYAADEEHVIPVLEETYLLERLVEDLRLLTLAESRQLHFEYRDVDLNQLAAKMTGLFQGEAEEKGIRLSVEPAAETASAHVDPQRTEQVLSNIVSNALRYTPEGGDVLVTVTKAAGRVILSVSDNGPGVPEQDIAHMFDRFWRGEKSRSRASGGAGLGLAIARQLVEAQGGEIHAENLPEKGLKVQISFPA
jgi:two-component system OmpR family sensor kinase/two-component system sensor histidine kinase BaeS